MEYELKGGEKMKGLVGVMMGSRCDWERMKNGWDMLEELEIGYEKEVVWGEGRGELMFEYGREGRGKGVKVMIGGGGGGGDLGGMVGGKRRVGVIGVGVE